MNGKLSNNSPKHRVRNVIIVVILVLLVLILGWGLVSYNAMRTGIQNYTPLGENSKVAELCLSQPQPYEWSGNIGFFDKEGNLSHPQQFHVLGERIQLHGDFVRLPSFLNMVAIPSGYRLISAVGFYTSSNSKNASTSAHFTHTTYSFEDEDWLITTAPTLLPFSWFVKPAQDNYNVPFNPSGTIKTTLYTIFATDQGLVLKAVPQTLSNCNTLPA